MSSQHGTIRSVKMGGVIAEVNGLMQYHQIQPSKIIAFGILVFSSLVCEGNAGKREGIGVFFFFF